MMKFIRIALGLLLASNALGATARYLPIDGLNSKGQGSALSTPASGYYSAGVETSDGRWHVVNSSGTDKYCPFSGAIVNADLSGSAAISNANLANPSTTVSGQTCTLGSTCTIPFSGLSGAPTVAQQTIANHAQSTCTTASTIDWSVSNSFTILLTNADACAITFSNASSGQAITIDLTQPSSTGSATVTWASSPKWMSGTAPTISTGANATDSITCKYNGTDYRCVAAQAFQ